ncbi:MAG TPA: hypothetical protein HA254_00875 [Candidatus Diapherotrites archaeon]|uniref:DNA polymerase II small subunit n=1 Tax=Candidatus Iainarchaeum sp. TaxID=3101447 RepID=A0A7J4IUT4_9ARCH|nr:hypothetical protein [Candidatus Diapherotrites archaeon]
MTLNGKDSKRSEIAQFCSEREQLIDLQSIDLLEGEEHWKDILESISEPMVCGQIVKERLLKRSSKLGSVKEEVVVKRATFTGLAKDSVPHCKVLSQFEVTGKSSAHGHLGDFLGYFRDKYAFLSSLLSHRAGFNPKPLDKLKSVQKYADVDAIGMVMRKWVSKNGNLTIELDSPEGRCILIISKEDVAANREAGRILLDDVIGVRGKKFSDEVIIAKSFLWPDMTQRSPKEAGRDLSVCLISDIHAGSRLFMEKEFMKFISWLNGNVPSPSEAERVGKIKYMVIAGDNVDGIGIYPDQFDELEIKDIFAQYEKLAGLLKLIPEHIEVFMIPGQHDAVRRADPQPAIPREYLKELQDYGNIHLVGSPGWIELEGLKCLIYHGASFHDMIAATRHLDYKEPHRPMAELLRRRDLSTGFGLTQPYVPESVDYMVIREEPDMYFGGDLHMKGYGQYRGCLLANAGCWQERTEYQIKEGHIPTPGIALDINLKSRKITENNFMGEHA